MREWEITYHSPDADTKGMRVKEICPVCQQELKEDWNGAHYACMNCKSITTACCGGASDGQSG